MFKNTMTFLVFALFLPLGKGCAVAAGDLGSSVAAAAGVPQIAAFLPMKDTVPKTSALAIDGIWKISANGKRIRIEAGRAYALDPWVHAFTLKIATDMVVVKNFRRTETGLYAAEDLPLMATTTYRLEPTGQLAVTAKTFFGPVPFKLLPIGLDNPSAFNQEMSGAGFGEISIPSSGFGSQGNEEEEYDKEYDE